MKGIFQIISWNVAGMKSRQQDIEQLIATYHPDVVCLQKTRTNYVPTINGYATFSSCTDRWSGIATYFREELDCRLIEDDTHHQVLDLSGFILSTPPFTKAKPYMTKKS